MVRDARGMRFTILSQTLFAAFNRRVLVSASRAIAANCNKDKAIFASISSIFVNAILPESRN